MGRGYANVLLTKELGKKKIREIPWYLRAYPGEIPQGVLEMKSVVSTKLLVL